MEWEFGTQTLHLIASTISVAGGDGNQDARQQRPPKPSDPRPRRYTGSGVLRGPPASEDEGGGWDAEPCGVGDREVGRGRLFAAAAVMHGGGEPAEGGADMGEVLRMALVCGALALAMAAPRAASCQDGELGVDPAGSSEAAWQEPDGGSEGYGSTGLAKEGVFVGGSLGLGFGDVDYVEIAPLVGTWLSPRASVGGSLIFRYRNDAIVRVSGGDTDSVSTTDYGGSVFGRYFVWDVIYLQTEVEYLSYEVVDFDLATERDDFTSVFVGGGAAAPIGGRSSISVEVLYNVTYADDEMSPYSSPWITRIGVGFGF